MRIFLSTGQAGCIGSYKALIKWYESKFQVVEQEQV